MKRKFIIFNIFLYGIFLVLIAIIIGFSVTGSNINEKIEEENDAIMQSKISSKELSENLYERETNPAKLSKLAIENSILNIKYPKKANKLYEEDNLSTKTLEDYEKKHYISLDQDMIKQLKEDLGNYKKFHSFSDNNKIILPIVASIGAILINEILNLLYKGYKSKSKFLEYFYTLNTKIASLLLVLSYFIPLYLIKDSLNIIYFYLITASIFLIYLTIICIYISKKLNKKQ
ncbi:hypothetical protein [Staphylococcus hominis]|uniref:hypothetical protein n=1 Tax=Staphylococcus hominis TaxID=1290 RepID=UPI003BF70AB5